MSSRPADGRAGLSSVFNQINRQLCQDLGAERFVTAFLGVLDPGGHCVNYRSAGDNLPSVVGASASSFDVAIAPSPGTISEWVGKGFAKELPAGPAEREFDMIISHDRELVTEAAHNLLHRMSPSP